MTARNYALIRNHLIENVIVLDDAVPFDQSFALWLTQFDEVAEVSELRVAAGFAPSPGHIRLGHGEPFAPPPVLHLPGHQPWASDVTMPADGREHVIQYINGHADAPTPAKFRVEGHDRDAAETHVDYDECSRAHLTVQAPTTPGTVTVTVGELLLTIRAV